MLILTSGQEECVDWSDWEEACEVRGLNVEREDKENGEYYFAFRIHEYLTLRWILVGVCGVRLGVLGWLPK